MKLIFFFTSVRPISRFIRLLVFSEIWRAILVKLDSSAWHCADLLFIQYEACTNHSRQNGTGRRPLIGYYASALSTYSQCIARCSMFTGITSAKLTMQTSTGGCGMQPGAWCIAVNFSDVAKVSAGCDLAVYGLAEQYGSVPFIWLFHVASQKLYMQHLMKRWFPSHRRRFRRINVESDYYDMTLFIGI